MDFQKILDRITETTAEEKKALDYIKVHKTMAKHLALLEIYNINVLDYVPRTLYESFMKNKNQALIPNYITLNENLAFDKNTNISLSRADRYIEMFPLKHNYYEIEYILSGSCKLIIQEQSYILSSGDIAIIPTNVIYQAIPNNDSIMINLKIRRSTFDKVFINLLSADTLISAYLSKTLYSKGYRSAMLIHCGNDEYLRNIFLLMFNQELEKKAFYQYMLEGMTITLFTYLIQNHSENIEMSNQMISNNERIVQITDYINANYMTVSLKEVADKFYISQSYLSALIKKELGITFSELLREIKMSKASSLLITTNLKIDDVCIQSGYEDTTQFIKTFKKYYGLSPKKYRIKSIALLNTEENLNIC